MRTIAISLVMLGACATGGNSAQDARVVTLSEISLRDVTRQVRNEQVPATRCDRYGGLETEVVKVRFDVLPSGRTSDVAVIDSTNPCHDRYAITSVLRWRYDPPMLDGEPVRLAGVTARVTFAKR